MDFIKNEILSDIRKAKKSIKVAVAWFTDCDLINAIINQIKKNKTLSVEMVISNHSDNKDMIVKEKITEMIALGAKVKIFGSSNPQLGNFMHCKFYIIDDEFAKSGSYNWSRGAEKNIECLDIVALDSKQKLFKRLLNNGNSYPTLKCKKSIV